MGVTLTLFNLSLDNTFDERTQSAISELQRHKIIRQSQSATTNGSVMTLEIYKAIGESMSAVQIEQATFNDQLLEHLLRGRYQQTHQIEYFRVTEMSEFKRLVTEFFKLYGQLFRRACWKVFAVDRNGNKSDVAQRMEKPSYAHFPFKEVVLGYSSSYLNEQGGYNCSKKQFVIVSDTREWDLVDGSHISAKDSFFRTLAHEYGNYISCKYTGDGKTFGTIDGVNSQVSANGRTASGVKDYDTVARLELELWGNISF